MNCDEVFVILTRGPFPSGSPHDGRVETHLRKCAECQRLAEALRPNDDGLHESIGLDDGGALPGYWGEPLTIATESAVSLSGAAGTSSLRSLSNRSVRALQGTRKLTVWQFAAAVALGIVVAAALRTLVAGHPSRPRFFSTAQAREIGAEYRPSAMASGEDAPSFLDRPAVCRGIDGGAASKSLEPITLADPQGVASATCCTVCHHAGGETKIPEAAKIRLQESCRDCHRDSGR